MTEATDSPHTVAFMDFGTNSVRLLIVRLESNHSLTVLQKLKETVRLGEGEFRDGQLQPNAMSRATDAAIRFAQAARSAGADEIVAVGTAAVREANNAKAFLQRLKHATGIEVRVISGQEEARLIYLGVASGVDIGDRQALFIDIGGGSTETAVGNQNEYFYLHSHKLGAIRLSSLFLSGSEGPVSDSTYGELRAYIQRSAAPTLRELADYTLDLGFGSSGTIESLAEVASRMKGTSSDAGYLTLGDLRAAIRHLRSLGLEARRQVPGLTPGRADIVIGGAAILDVFMDELGLQALRVSDRGLRDGLLVDYLQRHKQTDLFSELAPRERSVLQLGRSCRFNEQHARKVAELALALFDSAAECRLHKMGAWEREILEYAALLHHIGSFLTYSGYQKHSYYLISNADLLGFDQLETTLMALSVLHHRGSLPRKGSPELKALETGLQDTMRALSTFIRIAENLDRGQAGAVAGARLVPAGNGKVDLEIDAIHDPYVELAGVENHREVFEKVFKVSLKVRTLTRSEARPA
jgi:exopolyphosphatase / guanosine-5'-triphosphate,3'-diphosphate pyrophosphatase